MKPTNHKQIKPIPLVSYFVGLSPISQILCPVEIFDVTCSLVILFPPHNMKAIDIPIHKGYGVSFHDINHISQ